MQLGLIFWSWFKLRLILLLQYFQKCLFKSSRPDVFCKKSVLKKLAKLTKKHQCLSLYFTNFRGLRSAALLKKEIPTLVFSCQFCKLFKIIFFHRTPLVVASEKPLLYPFLHIWNIIMWSTTSTYQACFKTAFVQALEWFI